MKTKDLKSMIQQVVYESINEMLAQKYIQNVVTEAVQSVMSTKKTNPIQESKTPSRPPLPANFRNTVIEKMGLEQDSMMSDMFTDTARNGSSPTAQSINANEISEASMEKIGIFNKDWEKYI